MLCKATLAGQTIMIGKLALTGCNPSVNDAGISSTNAVRLLNKSTIGTNKKMANNPLFNFAAQLVAYRLNQPFGGWPDSVAAAAADYGQTMLVQLNFNGTATHGTPTAAATADLNYLAKVLDAYNNNTMIAGASPVLPYPGVYK